MARLTRQWGYQARPLGGGQWSKPYWSMNRTMADVLVSNGAPLGENRRLVSRVVQDGYQVEPRPADTSLAV